MTDTIVVRGLRLWAHVGVLDVERSTGQWFEADITLLIDLKEAGRTDDLIFSKDYALLIDALQSQARTINCQTLECYSEHILDLAESIVGSIPIELELRKCAAPVSGFNGIVGVCRRRHWFTSIQGGHS